MKYRLYNGTIDYDFGGVTLTSATSYGQQLQSFRADYTANLSAALAGAYVYFDQRDENRKWTQELRLASNGGDFIEWLVGGYYTHEKARIFQDLKSAVPGTPGVLTPIDLPYDLAVFNLDSRYEEIAGFANATLHLAPWFDIDLGGRYSHNSQRAEQATGGVLLGTDLVDGLRSSDNVFTWSVAPKVKFGEQASLYARIAKGYRPGGPNVIPIDLPQGTPTTYQPDTVTSYEIGFKGDTADRSASIEASLYHIDWTRHPARGGRQRLWRKCKRYEREGRWRRNRGDAATDTRPCHVDWLHLHRREAQRQHRPGSSRCGQGRPLPFTPKYAVNLNADYQWNLGSGITASIGGSIRSLSRQSGSFDPAYRAAYGQFARVGAYEVLDLRAGLDFGRYSLSAYANNVTNSGGITSTQALLGVRSLPRNANGALGTAVVRPRTIGINAAVVF